MRSNGRLDVFADNTDLLMRVVGEITHEFDLRAPTPRHSGLPGTGSNEASTAWIRVFFGDDFVGPPEREQYFDSLPNQVSTMTTEDNRGRKEEDTHKTQHRNQSKTNSQTPYMS